MINDKPRHEEQKMYFQEIEKSKTKRKRKTTPKTIKGSMPNNKYIKQEKDGSNSSRDAQNITKKVNPSDITETEANLDDSHIDTYWHYNFTW